VYAGEGFVEVAESFFGFMVRGERQRGRPFEPRTVRMKSELRGASRVALPLVFQRGQDKQWSALWLHLFLPGLRSGNRVEGHRIVATKLVRAMAEREYLRVRYLVDLMAGKGPEIALWDGQTTQEQVTLLGIARPEGLPAGSVAFTSENLRELIPARRGRARLVSLMTRP
jgi:hypothetical protein